jgi:hypothetical protein
MFGSIGRRSRKGEEPMLDEKKRLSLEELEDQVAFELPERELPALLIIKTVTGDIFRIRIHNVSIPVAVNLCVFALNVLSQFINVCRIQQ